MKRLSWSEKALEWQDLKGAWHLLRPVSITKRVKLLENLKQIMLILETSPNKNEPFSALYAKESKLQFYVLEIIKLLEIDPELISLDFIYALLFPHGERKNGLLVELNFTSEELARSISEDAKKKIEIEDTSAEVLKGLLERLLEVTQSLPIAIELLDNVSAIDFGMLLSLLGKKQIVEAMGSKPDIFKERLRNAGKKLW